MAGDAHDVCSGMVSTVPEGSAHVCSVVVLHSGANRILVDAQSVCGCTAIEKSARIPGAPHTVTGLIFFMGEIVPIIRCFGGSTECAAPWGLGHRSGSDQYAVIFSVRGYKFAARVDEPPRMCTDATGLRDGTGIEDARSNVCRVRTRHLARLIDTCIARTKEIASGESEFNNTSISDDGDGSPGIEDPAQTTATPITDLCCAT